MENALSQGFCLWGGAATLGLVLWLTWRRGVRSAGLAFCYLLSLSVIHLVGAWIATLPGSPSENPALVAVGFRECFAGMGAFTAGVLLVEVYLFRTCRRAHSDTAPTSPERGIYAASSPVGGRMLKRHECRAPVSGLPTLPGYRDKLAKAYVFSGVLCVAVLIPVLRSVPSFGAVANCGAYLIVAGFCLGCWESWQRGNRSAFLLWLTLTLGFPLFTMLTMGFLGYGALAAIMVFAFALVLYRPRWQAGLAFAVAGYLGLSLYVTYMRDRNDLRDTVWGGEAYSARLETIKRIFFQFELFSIANEQHLQAVDGRLNQNLLVGAAVRSLDSGLVPFARGQTLADAVLAVIPRALWPGKPVRAGSPEIVTKYTGISFAEGTSVGVGQVMEFYINFGRWGVIFGFFCFGLIVRAMDWKAASCLAQGDESGFVTWFLPGLAFLQTGGSLVEVFGTAAASFVLVYGVNHFALPLLRPKELRNPATSRKRRARALIEGSDNT